MRNLPALRIHRGRLHAAVNVQLDARSLYVGALWHYDLQTHPGLFGESWTHRRYDLWLHPLPILGLHFLVWWIS